MSRLRVPPTNPSPDAQVAPEAQIAPDTGERRSKLNAMIRGFLGHCPRCGMGRVLQGYLTVVPRCPHCGEGLGHIRADDGPAYFTILIVGHIVVPASLLVEQTWAPPMIPHMAVSMVIAGLLIWKLLPATKGAMVGLMWALGLKGDERQGDH